MQTAYVFDSILPWAGWTHHKLLICNTSVLWVSDPSQGTPTTANALPWRRQQIMCKYHPAQKSSNMHPAMVAHQDPSSPGPLLPALQPAMCYCDGFSLPRQELANVLFGVFCDNAVTELAMEVSPHHRTVFSNPSFHVKRWLSSLRWQRKS